MAEGGPALHPPPRSARIAIRLPAPRPRPTSGGVWGHCGRYGPAPRPVRCRDLHGALLVPRTAGPATCSMPVSSAARTAPREVWHSAPRTGGGCTGARAALPGGLASSRACPPARAAWHMCRRVQRHRARGGAEQRLWPGGQAGQPASKTAAGRLVRCWSCAVDTASSVMSVTDRRSRRIKRTASACALTGDGMFTPPRRCVGQAGSCAALPCARVCPRPIAPALACSPALARKTHPHATGSLLRGDRANK